MKIIKVERHEEQPIAQDLPGKNDELSGAVRELQRLQRRFAQLEARPEPSESNASSDDLLQLPCETNDPTPKPPSAPQGAKRRPESMPEPTTSKRARKHTDSEQPQRSVSLDVEHGSQPVVSQRRADNPDVLLSARKPAVTQEHSLLVKVPVHHGTTVQVPASPPVPSASKPCTRIVQYIKTTADREGLEELDLEAYFLRLSRVKSHLEMKLASEDSIPWVRHYPETPHMISKMSQGLENISVHYMRTQLDFSEREWRIWRRLDHCVEELYDREDEDYQVEDEADYDEDEDYQDDAEEHLGLIALQEI
jgi:hypothetical protein